MTFFLKSFYKLFLIFFISLLYLLIIELIIRFSIFLVANEKNYFFYGFNKNIKIEIVDLSEFRFNLNDLRNKNTENIKLSTNNLNETKSTIWVFGASLTYGFACGSNSSSWPEELNKINKNFDIINFGFPSIYSDDSIKILTYELNNIKNNYPDYILWAHRDEEILASVRGFNRNKDKINIGHINNIQNTKFYLLRVEKTLEDNLVSYTILKHIFKKISKRYNLNVKEEFLENDFLLSSKNFELNTIDAIKIAKNYGVKKFYIISPFDDEQFLTKENNKKKFLFFYNKVVKKLSEEKFVELIDLFKLTPEEIKPKYESFFCENKHYTLHGNQVISQIINSKLILD